MLDGFITDLETSRIIYDPSYYLKFITDSHADDIGINEIKKNYMRLIKETFQETITTNDKYNDCSIDYSIRMLIIPIFWQEIVLLIYMALCLHRYVTNNSRVISLGESPSKLVFIQHVLTTIPDLNNILKTNRMASNDIDYTYFPISGLGSYHDYSIPDKINIFKVKAEIEFDSTVFIKYTTQIKSQLTPIISNHFSLFKLDPRSIIASNKKIYFEDRMEGYKTLITLICFYDAMCQNQNLTRDERDQLYELLYFIGFDRKTMNNAEDIANDNTIIARINDFLYKTIKNQDPAEGFKPHFIQKNFNPIKEEEDDCKKVDFNILSNQRNILSKMFVFLTTPEETFNSSRCVKSCIVKYSSSCPTDIKRDFDATNTFHLKDTDNNVGKNCNIINLFLMILIHELGSTYISNIITNLDNIADDIFINNIDFINITPASGCLAAAQASQQRAAPQINIHKQILDSLKEKNILYDKTLSKETIDTVYSIIEDFILKTGIFSKCTYELPLKKSDGGKIINGIRRRSSVSRKKRNGSRKKRNGSRKKIIVSLL